MAFLACVGKWALALWPPAARPAAAPGQTSLVTWNVLAPLYAPASKYPWATAEALDWPARRGRIVSRLSDLDADVVCLQEVQVSLWDGLHHELQALGYDGVLQETKDHPVGNAVLVRRGQLELVRSESRSRALITVLQGCAGAKRDAPASRLYLANVHLEAGAEKASQRLAQIRSLLKRLELQCSRDVAERTGRPLSLSPRDDAAGAAVVVAGDFNCDRRSPLHRMLVEDESVAATAAEEAERALTSGQGKKAPGSIKRFSRTLLPLHDAYLDTSPPWGPPLRSSYRNGRLLDFVMTTPQVQARSSSQPEALARAAHHPAGIPPFVIGARPFVAPRLAPCASRGPCRRGRHSIRRRRRFAPPQVLRTMPVCTAAGSSHPHRIPSTNHPSDHFPVGALLGWPGAPSEPRRQRPNWQNLFVESVQS